MTALTVHSHYFGAGGWMRHAQQFVAALSHRLPLGLSRTTRPRRGEAITPLARELLARGAAASDDGVALGIGPFDLMSTLVGRVRIGYVVWETSRIPPHQLAHLSRLDEIWTATEWGRELLVANGVPAARVFVVPQGVDTDHFSPAAAPPSGRFRFLSVGKWEVRKATAELVRTFTRSFASDADVELHLHAWNPMHPDRDLGADVDRVAPPPRPNIIAGRGPIDEAALLALYRSAHAFVLPTRGEGWGLPVLEAMAAGLPVLVTDHSALRTFVDDDCGWLIRSAGRIDVVDPLFFRGGGYGDWLEPDFEQLAELLRYVVAHRDEAQQRGRRARAAARRWTWDAAAAAAAERLAHWGVGKAVATARSHDLEVRPAFGDQDAAILREVIDRDGYTLRELLRRGFRLERVMDIGAHIGGFAAWVHRLAPDAEIVCVEPDPGNFDLLRRNAPFARHELAACSYERGELAVFSTLHPGGRSTGGSFVAPRDFDISAWVNRDEYRREPHAVRAITLEDIVASAGWSTIDLLKLDCEGKGRFGEWSILRHTTLLDRIAVIVGEYHGEARQSDEHGVDKLRRLLAERFAGWEVTHELGEHGHFRLINPKRGGRR